MGCQKAPLALKHPLPEDLRKRKGEGRESGQTAHRVEVPGPSHVHACRHQPSVSIVKLPERTRMPVLKLQCAKLALHPSETSKTRFRREG